MGLAEQEEVKNLATTHGAENLIIVFGMNQPFSLRIMARTFHDGDPSYAGPLAGISLGLKSYHILEFKEFIPAEVWDEQMAMYELEIEDDARKTILQIMKEARHQ